MPTAAQSNAGAQTYQPNPYFDVLSEIAGPSLASALLGPKFPKEATVYSSEALNSTSVAVGDLNGDGTLDLVIGNYCQSASVTGACVGSGAVSVLLGNGDGTFQPAVVYQSGGLIALSVAIGDINGDGHPDLVVADDCQYYSGCTGPTVPGGVSILLGNGDGTFRPPVVYNSGGFFAGSVGIDDVNGDGHPDVIVANACQSFGSGNLCGPGFVSVLLGNGDGTLQSAVSYGSGGNEAIQVAVRDLNGDGRPDLVVVNRCQGNCNDYGPGNVEVLLNNGDGTFRSLVSYPTGGGEGATALAVEDVNGDGRPDLVVTIACISRMDCSNGLADVFLGNGDGTFQPPVSNDAGSDPTAVAIGDVNGDGIPDLALAINPCAVCDSAVAVALGNGDGTFQAPISYDAGGNNASAVVFGDLNRDGRPDLAIASQCDDGCLGGSQVGVLLNKAVRVTSTASLSSSPNPSSVNESVTFTAKISSSVAIPNGSDVVFHNGGITIGTATTKNGVATLTTPFSKAETYSITATYHGDAFHWTSSHTIKQTVMK